MGQWTDVDPNTLLPGDPWTSGKAQAAFENVEALAEQATGAPKLAARFVNGQSSPGGALTFSGLGDFGGVIAHIKAFRSGASDSITLAFSSDGSTYSTPVTIANNGAGEILDFTLFFDFASGNWLTQRDDGTIAGASLSITHVRFNSVGSDIDVLMNPQGGASA